MLRNVGMIRGGNASQRLAMPPNLLPATLKNQPLEYATSPSSLISTMESLHVCLVAII
jgi:hypothetical protein